MPFCKLFPGLFLIMMGFAAKSQQINFLHYTEINGLVQSQVNAMCQDNFHHIWFATMGGISRFDGTEFMNYTDKDGLLNNYVNCIYADKENRVWAGTAFGLSCFNGTHFANYLLPKKTGTGSVSNITEDGMGGIWFLIHSILFTLKNDSLVQVFVGKDSNDFISGIARCPDGSLSAAVYSKGIYCLRNGQWEMTVDFKKLHLGYFFNHLYPDPEGTGKIWLQYRKGLILIDQNRVLDSIENIGLGDNFRCLSFCRDKDSDIWIGTNRGAYRYANNRLNFYSAGNGFTDNTVNFIFHDNENNLWFATNSSGVYRYSADPFQFVGEAEGLKSPVIMAIAADKSKKIWLGTYGDGLYCYDPAQPEGLRVTQTALQAQRINHLFVDRQGNTWVATDNQGIWKYRNESFERVDNEKIRIPPSATQITQDFSDAIWISTPVGCYRLQDGNVTGYLKSTFCSSVYCYSRDSVFIGTQMGLYLCVSGKDPRKIFIPGVDSSSVLCMNRNNSDLFIGTGERGIFKWNLQNGSVKNFTAKSGLNSDAVYNLYSQSTDSVWVGTSRGINLLHFNIRGDNPHIANYSEPGTKSAAEGSQNAVCKSGYNIWFGTTQGAILIDGRIAPYRSARPHMVLQSVLLFGNGLIPLSYCDSLSSWYHIPAGMKLPHDQNNLTFTFRAISFRNNKSNVYYQYKMDGVDKTFSSLTLSPIIVYPSLLPGKYKLLIKSFAADAGFSDNTIEFPFEIRAAFYQEVWFYFLAAIFVLTLSVTFYHLKKRRAELRSIEIERLKKEEQSIIRKRTSEDFHDELGNKLTRLTVLSNILQTHALSPQSNSIVLQMKENISILYTGMQDIIWALQPGSDQLGEIIKRLDDFGMELFQGTKTTFRLSADVSGWEKTRMTSSMSRNIVMIFKEAINNSLKHSESTHVWLDIYIQGESQLVFKLNDDGKGFNPAQPGSGYGLSNMSQRAKRFGGELCIKSTESQGAQIILFVNVVRMTGK